MSTVSDDPLAYGGSPIARVDIDWTQPEPITAAVTAALVREGDVELADLEPLAASVDTDALERLFADGGAEVTSVEFIYGGHAVVVTTDELVVWREL